MAYCWEPPPPPPKLLDPDTQAAIIEYCSWFGLDWEQVAREMGYTVAICINASTVTAEQVSALRRAVLKCQGPQIITPRPVIPALPEPLPPTIIDKF